MTELSYGWIEEYEKWLESKDLDKDKVRNSLYPNEKHMLLTAFRRETRKGWKITQRELFVMLKYRKEE